MSPWTATRSWLVVTAAAIAAWAALQAHAQHDAQQVAPASPPGSAASAPTAVVPPELFGIWMPVSRALEPLKPLTLTANTLDWSICRGAAVRAMPAASSASGVTLDLAATGCELDGRKLSHLSIVPRDGGCDAELSLFTSAEMLAAGERDAWGVITLPKCRER
jgi:hypothetical protein